MKTGILTTKTIASDDIQSSKSIMGMSAKGMDMAAYFMRDKIYTDKNLAVVREYISNALDEHKQHKIDLDVLVETKMVNGKYVWSVRDYAHGLDENGIRNIFGMYFESTKSQTNDSIGGFGIGSKSAFSYTDTFYVTSYHQGVKTLYVCTLGAGDKGIPVGQIYEVSKEPTTEQGIEVSLEINNYDLTYFNNHTVNLVHRLPKDTKILFKRHDGIVFSPLVPVETKVMGDYILNSYDNTFTCTTEKRMEIRIGGIVYPYSRSTFINKMNWNPAAGVLVVDVPIGKLTLPISREAIEATPLNNKVMEEIISLITKECALEASSQQVPKFGELMAQDYYATGRNFTGKFFKHDFRSMFPTSATYQQVVKKYLSGEEDYSNSSQVFAKSDTHTIYVTPDIKTVRPWYRRLRLGLTELMGAKYEGYMTISNKHYQEILNLNAQDLASIDTSDCVFVDVKTLKLPKLATTTSTEFSQRKWVTYVPNSYTKCYFTASEIEENCKEMYFNKQDAPDDWADKADSIDKLNRRTITKSTLGLGCWTVGSQKLIEDLVENNGWLEYQSVDYNAQRDRIIKHQEVIQHQRNAHNELTKYLYGAVPSKFLVEAVKSNKDRLTKLVLLRDKLMSETTLRGKIMKMVARTHYYSDVKITRDDIRKILRLK